MVALFAQQSNIVEFPQKSNEWYTPSKYVEAARLVMGGIDLDPASNKKANETIKAPTYYTKEQNGLAQEWHGRVWLNPPYGREGVETGMAHGPHGASLGKCWIDRLIDEYRLGNVSQAILLGKADVKQIWFQPLWEYPICFAYDRVYFERPGLPPSRVMFGTIFVYLGENEQKFIEVFSKFGTVARRVSAPKVQPVNLSLWKEI